MRYFILSRCVHRQRPCIAVANSGGINSLLKDHIYSQTRSLKIPKGVRGPLTRIGPLNRASTTVSNRLLKEQLKRDKIETQRYIEGNRQNNPHTTADYFLVGQTEWGHILPGMKDSTKEET